MADEAAKPQRELTPEQWQDIREILATALELPSDQRSSYLGDACRGDSTLHSYVLALIYAHDSTAARRLDSPAFRTIPSDFPHQQPGASVLGRRIGVYRIEAEIARGGMGTVFRAVRDDDEFHKQVAIKLVAGAAISSHAAEMFRRERHVLATLEHPNIARLIDGGTTEDGNPYLVMEYVEGERVTNYCSSNNLSMGDRLTLFQKICSAVRYAHQNLVIHRDIKPANILVTPEGEPKLLDFGIAKLIDLEEGGNTTATFWGALTPAYASPEQIMGERISTATDVHGLGLVLYELLTERQAFPSTLSNLQLQRAVLELDPEPPSRAVLRGGLANREQLSAELQGDLDSIVRKALRKSRNERYPSVEQFADDVRRHLANLPVLAHSDTVLYRLTKFAHRHRTGMIAAALVFASLLVGIVVSTHEARVARAQRERAERRFSDVRQLANSLLFDVHDAVQDLPGSTPARKLIVEKSLQYLDSLSSEKSNDPTLLRELATAYARVGELQGHYLADNLGENSSSLASYKKALAIRQQLGEAKTADKQDRLSLAESYRRTASQLMAMGNGTEGLADIKDALAITEPLAKANPDDSKVLYELGFDYEILANIQGSGYFAGLGDLVGSLESCKKAVAVDAAMLHLDPNNLSAQRSMAMDLLQTGEMQSDLGYASESLASRREALEMFVAIAQRTGTVKDRRRIAVVYNEMGTTYDNIGNRKLSFENHQKALEIYKELIKEDPKNALLRQGLAISYADVGDAESKLSRMGDARADFTRALAIMNTVSTTDANSQQRGVIAQMHMLLADSLAHDHRFAAALVEYRNALHTFADMHLAGTEVDMAACTVGVADAERQIGNLDGAVTDFRQALALAGPHVSPKDHTAVLTSARAYEGLADLESALAEKSRNLEKDNHWANAVKWYRQSVTIAEQAPPAQREGYDYSREKTMVKLRKAEASARLK